MIEEILDYGYFNEEIADEVYNGFIAMRNKFYGNIFMFFIINSYFLEHFCLYNVVINVMVLVIIVLLKLLLILKCQLIKFLVEGGLRQEEKMVQMVIIRTQLLKLLVIFYNP
jgi:hypothetical protein